MYQMSRAYPYLQTELYDQYFYSTGRFVISEQDKQYIQDLGTLRVAFCDGNALLQCVRNGEVQGMAAIYFEALAEATGLQYEPVIVQSCADGVERIQRGEVDLIACAASTSSYITVGGIQFTYPYFNGSSVVVLGPSISTPPDDEDSQRFYSNTQAVLNNLRTGEMGCGRLDMYSVNYYLQKQELYESLTVDWSKRQKRFLLYRRDQPCTGKSVVHFKPVHSFRFRCADAEHVLQVHVCKSRLHAVRMAVCAPFSLTGGIYGFDPEPVPVFPLSQHQESPSGDHPHPAEAGAAVPV